MSVIGIISNVFSGLHEHSYFFLVAKVKYLIIAYNKKKINLLRFELGK